MSLFTNFSLFSIATLGVLVGPVSAQVENKSKSNNTVLDRLERGEVVSAKSGQACLIQAIVKKDAASVLKVMAGDLKALGKVLPQVAFAKPLLTEDGKRILYLKLRGLGDGLGVLMEVKQGASDAFANARALLRSAELNQLRDTHNAVNDVDDSLVLKGVEDKNKSGEVTRILGGDQVILLEGPLNPIMSMPNLRITAEVSVAPYTIMEKPSGVPGAPAPKVLSQALLQIRMAVGNQVTLGGELGDYRGFGDQRLELARITGEEVLRGLRARLEQL